jgi:hypothetical protein
MMVRFGQVTRDNNSSQRSTANRRSFGEISIMAEPITDELKTQVIEFFKKKNKMLTSRDVAKGLDLPSRAAKKAITALVNEGTLEFESFGGATFIKLPADTSESEE